MDYLKIIEEFKLKSSTRAELCRKHGISQRTLSRLLSKYGLVRKNYGPKKLTDTQIYNIREIYNSGNKTQKTLSEIFGISQAMVCKIVNQAPVKNPLLGGAADVKLGYKFNGD